MTQTRNLIDENGKRTDGRGIDELREVKITVGTVKNADGSAFIEFGKNKILAAVYGPREVHPKHMAQSDRCVLRCRYHMSPFSTDTRKNPAPSRREVEISKVMREALEPALMLEDYPRAAIDVFVEVLQSDGGSRCAGITAAAVALADAGINMRDLVAACAAGKVDDKIVLDINDTEDKEGSADMPVAYMPRLEQITLLQLDGKLTPDQFNECLDKAIGGCKMVYEIQKQALMQKYFGNETELKEEAQ
ncbi:putative exosome complex exonuclease [Candidatus Nitrososphaera gargensis Ga9.2]|uniref:Exosome complex component Rrp41 n=1 Tax=Nitrososphaera gargensis (strain Ga9.2) TaxID=1237085 RepID=K0ID49_NITGG|nr:exosome complex exonuclease Rrp41 [Candidatus Nitrososphaera gargensis]AFU59311.1 putative exosome complex exonuclease [Candidatus Nitrososphaera gargensis Ga9.2]